MMCLVGTWLDSLDAEDTASFDAAQDTRSRVDLHNIIVESENGVQPFSLTTLKMHVLKRCHCE